MSLRVIRATFECEGCAKEFRVDIEPSAKNWERRQCVLDFAIDAVRGGVDSDGNFCSVQADMVLCESCTKIADNIRPDEEDYTPSADEIKEALGAI